MINKIIKVQRGTKEINRLRTTNQTLRIEKCNLIKANERKQKRIDKAIKYIENTKFDLSDDEYDLREYDGKRLLEILKGEDK